MENSQDLRGLTRSALGPVAGESSSEGADQDSLNSGEEVPPRNISRTSYVIDDHGDDDIDDEITAVFADGHRSAEGQDTMSKSWHGSRSSSQKSLSFFVDFDSSGPPPPLSRSMSHSQSQRRVSSARSRTRTGSCSTSFFVDLNQSSAGVRSTSRLENSNQLNQMSTDIRTKSKQLLARNLQQSQIFFTKLKAFIDFLNMPNYSKEEVRQKKILADKITRVMFEEEQRLRRGMDLTEIQQLDKILNIKNIRPTSAYATMQNSQTDDQHKTHGIPKLTTTQAKFSTSTESSDKPILRRERTFDLDSGSSIVNKELKALKKQNRKSMPVHLTIPIIDPVSVESIKDHEQVGWMMEDSKKPSEKEMPNVPDPRAVCDDFNLLQYFQEQRLEHTRLLRKEIQRLESLEKVYLSTIKQPKSKPEENKSRSSKEHKEKRQRKMEDKSKITTKEKVKLREDEVDSGFSRNDTFTKSDRRRISEKISNKNSNSPVNGQGNVKGSNYKTKIETGLETSSAKEKMTTSFKEVADKKMRNESSPILNSNPNSPLSWYIPSDPPSRCQSKNSENSNQVSRQNSYEHEYYGYSSPPPVTACRSSQTSLRSQASSVSIDQSQARIQHGKIKSRHFGQMYPSRQHSQDSEAPSNQCRGIQTGSSLLRMYLKKADKSQQLSDRPQAFFLPLEQNADDKTNLIDLETSTENDLTDLQKALRKHRPDYIAAAEERAGRLSRNTEDKKPTDNVMTRSIENRLKKPSSISLVKRSQSTPRVSSILKFGNTNSTISNGMNALKNGFSKKTDGKSEKKSVTIMHNG